MRATGRNIFFRYADKPGALGTVGTALGADGINIQAAALTQGKVAESAVLILRVDREVPEALVESISAKLEAEAFQFDLSE